MENWREFLLGAILVSETVNPSLTNANTSCGCVDKSESNLSISQIQTILYKNGFSKYLENVTFSSGIADGICGPETRTAIMAFQSKHTLQVDACVGDETEGKMRDLGLLEDLDSVPTPADPNIKKISINIQKNNNFNLENFNSDQVIAYLIKGSEKKPVTMNDALWFAKMIHGETYGNPKQEDAIYMVWSLINRLGRGWWSMELSKYVQYYSQPISPAWVSGGSRCTTARQKALKTKERKSKAKNPKKWFYNPCSQARLKKRKEFRSLTAETVSPLALEIVLKVFRGEIPAPPEPVSGWFANFMFNKNADASGVWTGGEGPGTKLRKVIEVRKNSFYERVDVTAREVSIEPVN